MFKSFWGSQGPEPPRVQEIPSQSSWYPPSVVGSTNPPSLSNSSPSGDHNIQRPSDPTYSTSVAQLSPSEATSIIHHLKDKSFDELRKLLSDSAYNHFLLSLDQVRTQNNLRDELRNETLQLARKNMEKEPQILELRNQCRIIRTTELAAAQEKLDELERQKEETLQFYSPSMLLKKLQDAMNKTDEESEILNRKLLEEIDLNSFVQKYKNLRTNYHKNALTHLAAKTSFK